MTFDPRLATRIPNATYRVQLNKNFGFREAAKIVPYLKRLGISDIYTSPILKARSGSLHCYDVTDHAVLNPEIGTTQDFNSLVEDLHSARMGVLLDIVPNHMALSHENRLLMDVLKFGPSSKYAKYFDIYWDSPMRGKILLPLLGDKISKVLREGKISPIFSDGEFLLRVYGMDLPLTPSSYARILQETRQELRRREFSNGRALRELGESASRLKRLPDPSMNTMKSYPYQIADRERKLLERLCSTYPEIERAIGLALRNSRVTLLLMGNQFYKLEFWKDAIRRLNYRRFATINDLIGICVERTEVFEESHRLVLDLVAKKKINGLRIDHIDGLLEPSAYLARLQKRCQESLNRRRESFYVVVEKILGDGEEIPKSWKVHGTSGYEFLCDLNNIFVKQESSSRFDKIYSRFTRESRDFQKIAEHSKRKIIDSRMSAELTSLARLFIETVEDSDSDSYSLHEAAAAIREVAVSLSIYRTYSDRKISPTDRRSIELAIGRAQNYLQSRTGNYEDIMDKLGRVLTMDFEESLGSQQRQRLIRFVKRFQQFTGPVAAKGVEDTAFYIYNRLVSLNEVGGNPANFGISVDEFHRRNINRLLSSNPLSLLATSTHDTKRSEDARAKINVLSEMPDEWESELRAWSALNERNKPVVDGKSCPTRNDEYLLYQSMLGIWPLGMISSEELKQRIISYMKKAVREEKLRTSWINPNPKYEQGLDLFISRILEFGRRRPSASFLTRFVKFNERIGYCGMLNSLSQLVLKLTSPGVPDIYQGSEIWDYSLVDPDNRRRVDFDLRARMLSNLDLRIIKYEGRRNLLARDLVSEMESGLVKMYVLSESLKFRAKHEKLFREGDYIPLEVKGSERDHICAFRRKNPETDDEECIVVAPRMFVSLLNGARYENQKKNVWKDTKLVLSGRKNSKTYRDIFTGNKIKPDVSGSFRTLALSEILEDFPLAILHPQ